MLRPLKSEVADLSRHFSTYDIGSGRMIPLRQFPAPWLGFGRGCRTLWFL